MSVGVFAENDCFALTFWSNTVFPDFLRRKSITSCVILGTNSRKTLNNILRYGRSWLIPYLIIAICQWNLYQYVDCRASMEILIQYNWRSNIAKCHKQNTYINFFDWKVNKSNKTFVIEATIATYIYSHHE